MVISGPKEDLSHFDRYLRMIHFRNRLFVVDIVLQAVRCTAMDILLRSTVSLIRSAAKDGWPVLVGIDGRSGAGKSTFAAALAEAISGQIVEGDAFFAGGVNLRHDTPEQLADICIDRPKLRSVLETLRGGATATFREFDWDAFDGSLSKEPTTVQPGQIMIIEGVYSCHPDLVDLLGVKIKLRIPEKLRERRLIEREGVIGPWERQWHRAEEWYFSHLAVNSHFDLVGC